VERFILIAKYHDLGKLQISSNIILKPDALTEEVADAIEELKRNAGTQFDPVLVEKFVGMLSK
jgi:HD-GYP domain-containing protein (c-di-GMP phosphodiesterase class II)